MINLFEEVKNEPNEKDVVIHDQKFSTEKLSPEVENPEVKIEEVI